jgi:hypothetical protein
MGFYQTVSPNPENHPLPFGVVVSTSRPDTLIGVAFRTAKEWEITRDRSLVQTG